MSNKVKIYRKKPAISYPGSLIQQNHAESLTHGYLLWDINSKKNTFIKIDNDYGYYTLDIKDENIIKNEEVPKKCKLRLNIHQNDISVIRNIIKKVKLLYKPLEITINRINNSSSFSSNLNNIDNIGNVYDINYQNKLLKDYLENTYDDITEQKINNIVKINSDINYSIELDNIVKNIRWSPIRFEWSNMFSYGEKNVIDFTNLTGAIGLFAPNRSGKTGAIDSLIFCLFDKTTKESKTINILNNKKSAFECLFEFELNNIHYFIKRNVHKNKAGNLIYKVNFWKLDSHGNKISLNGENRWGTNLNIKNIIGSFNDFILTSLSTQSNNASLIDKGNTERKDLIIKFIGIGIYDKLYEVASTKYKEILAEIRAIQSDEDYDILLNDAKELLKQQYDEYKKLNINKKKHDKLKNKIDKKINEIFNKIVTNIDDSLDINELKNNKADILKKLDKYNTEYIDIKNNRIKLQNDILNLQKNIDSYDDTKYKSLLLLKSEYENLSDKLNKLQKNIQNKVDKEQKLLKLKYDPNCEYCMNNIFVKDAIQAKDELISDNKLLNGYTILINKILSNIKSKNDIEEEYNKHENYKKDVEQLKIDKLQLDYKYSNYTSTIKSLNIDIENIDKNIETYNKTKNDIIMNKKYYDIIDELKIERKNLIDSLSELDNKILTLFGNIKVSETNIKTIESNISKLDYLLNKKQNYNYYLDSIKRDGIPSQLISNIIPQLETEINNILHQIVDFSILINLDDSKNINMQIVYDDINAWSLESVSGMEKFISSIAIRTALINISNLPRPNFIIIDEGFGTLDSENLNSVSTLIDYLKNNFDFIIVISHVDQIRDVTDSYIEIKNHYGFSYINHQSL